MAKTLTMYPMFPSRDQLELAYAQSLGMDCIRTAVDVARQKVKYVPHIYRGGWFIPGFGYSTERIPVYVGQPDAGDPYAAVEMEVRGG